MSKTGIFYGSSGGNTESIANCGTLCDAMGKIYQAVVDNCFMGLAIDEDNKHNLSEARINAWVEKIKATI